MTDFHHMMATRALTTNQAAERLGMYPEELRKLSKEGGIPSFLVGPRFLVFDRLDVETYLEQHGRKR